MGSIRVARKSVLFATRARKRLLVFVIIFGILSGATILLVGTFDTYSKQNLIDQRGINIKENSDYSINYAQYNSVKDRIFAVAGGSKVDIHPIRYFDFPSGSSPSVRILGIDADSEWSFSQVKPNSLKSGCFLKNNNEAMISEGFVVPLNWSEPNSNLSASLKVGNRITFSNLTDSKAVKITGLFSRKPEMRIHWLIVSNPAFDDLLGILGKSNIADVSFYEVIFLAKGGLLEILTGEAYDTIDTVNQELGLIGVDTATYGDWTPSNVDRDAITSDRDRDLLSFIVGIVGGIIVATLYAYLITRFRRREVAILKAIGFNGRNVRITLLSEILTVEFFGFSVAAILIESFYRLTASSAYIPSLFTSFMFLPYFPSTTILISGSVIVLTCIPGSILISWRTISVRPIEIFKER